jgi:hypothetical protein
MVLRLIQEIDIYLHDKYIHKFIAYESPGIYSNFVILSMNFYLNVANIGSIEILR